MRVAIRADASSHIGSGHVMRCKTLADELRRRGADVRFVCRERPGHLIPLLRSGGYPLAMLPALEDVEQSADAEQTVEALNGFGPDWLIVDHYTLDTEWESRLRPHVDRILAIDDLANRHHACHVLLDQNWFGDETNRRYDNLVLGECERLLGPQYALLQPAFGHLRRSLPPRDGSVRRVLVFFGAVDSANQTVKALQALRDSGFADLAVDVVVGYANPRAPEIESLVAACPGDSLHRQLPNLAGVMAKADLMLCAGGSTTWERCCLGLPAVVVVAAENQKGFTTALAKKGVHCSLGDASTVEVADWAEALHELRTSPERVRAYGAAAREMTDGLGTSRVAAAVQAPPNRGANADRFAVSS